MSTFAVEEVEKQYLDMWRDEPIEFLNLRIEAIKAHRTNWIKNLEKCEGEERACKKLIKELQKRESSTQRGKNE